MHGLAYAHAEILLSTLPSYSIQVVPISVLV